MISILKTFYLSIMAGICISLGASFYLIIPNPYLAAGIFSLGIILVMIFQFKLFTGVIPKIFQIKQSIEEILAIYFGNVVGTAIFSSLIESSSKYSQIYAAAEAILSAKADPLRCLVAAVGCGIIIGFIVNIQDKILKYILSIPLIMIFILLGFDHCIATSFYMFVCGQINAVLLAAITIGNIVGGLLVSVGMSCYTE